MDLNGINGALRKKLQLNAVYDGEVFCGMVCYYISDNTVYLAYLAAEPELRGNGYGSRILHMLEENIQISKLY